MEITLYKKDHQTFVTDLDISKLPTGEMLYAEVKVLKKHKRSYEQLKLYWQACKFIAFNCPENKEYLNSKKKADFYCKLNFELGEWVNIKFNKEVGGNLFIAGSVSYDNLKHLEACEYFNKSFELLAGELSMSDDEFISAVKESVGQI